MSAAEEQDDSPDSVAATTADSEIPPVRGRGRRRRQQAKANGKKNGHDHATASELDARLGKRLASFAPVEEVARQLAVDTNALDESEPSQRERPTFGGAAGEAEDLSDNIIRTYDELVQRYPIGDGQYFIQVDRKSPKSYSQVQISGLQRPVREPMTLDQFIENYGGGEYLLTVFGPPKRAQLNGAGAPVYKAFTKPIRLVVPMATPPNVNAAFHHGDDMEATTRGVGVRTNADARMHEVDVRHRETMDERNHIRTRQEREEAQRLQQEVRRAETEALRITTEAQERELARLDAHRAREKEDMERRLQEAKDQQLGFKELLPLITQRGNPPEIERLEQRIETLMESHRTEITLLTTQHREELSRLSQSHQSELSHQRTEIQAERSRVDARIREAEAAAKQLVSDAERRAADRIKEVETRAADRVREVEDRARTQVAEAERQLDRRVTELHQQHANRLTDEQRNHDRDQKSQEMAFQMRLDTANANLTNQIAIKDQEISRLRSELDEARAKANQPLSERIAELTESAEAIGMRPAGDGDSEPESWQQIGMKAISSIAGNLPEIVKNAGETYRAMRPSPTYSAQQQAAMAEAAAARRAAAFPPQQAAGPHVSLPPRRGRVGFATEDGPSFSAGSGLDGLPAVVPPEPLPISPLAPLPPPPVPVQAIPQPQSAPPAAAQLPTAVAPSVPPAAAAAPPAEEVSSGEGGPSFTLEQLLQVESMLVSAMKQGASPEDVAKYLASIDANQLRTILESVKPEDVQAALRRVGKDASPLCRRDGRKFLDALWVSGKKLLQ